MDLLSNRKKHEPSTNLKDVILCCRHATKTFTELNGFLIEKNSKHFCYNFCNELTQVYVFTCKVCFNDLQNKTVSLYQVNFGCQKYYLDKRDIRQVCLSGLYRFRTLDEANSAYRFELAQLQIS